MGKLSVKIKKSNNIFAYTLAVCKMIGVLFYPWQSLS